jgi:hypothetical protein
VVQRRRLAPVDIVIGGDRHARDRRLPRLRHVRRSGARREGDHGDRSPGTIGVGSTVEIVVSDPCFVDVTDVDVGDFCGVGYAYEETLQLGPYTNRRGISTDPTIFAYGARRRIPRPFLVRSVRKVSVNSPEQQQDRRYQRAFTMSLRAGDPRLYVLDEHRVETRLQGTPKFVSLQSPSIFTLETAGLPVPSGFTYEGDYRTAPGGGPTYRWSEVLSEGSRGLVELPVRAVGVKTWSDVNGTFGTAPTSDIKTRMYRSSEGYTYGDPRVVLGCAPQSLGLGASFSDLRGMNVLYSGSAGSRVFKYNTATILLKRVSSTTWLELRWNSYSTQASFGIDSTVEPNAPGAFELWCSHNASGTLTTTMLRSWDYSSYDSTSGLYPFQPSRDPMYLVSWMTANVVHWELWSAYPSLVDPSLRLEQAQFSLPSGLVSVVGSGVAGSSGWSTRIGGSGSNPDFAGLAATPPIFHYYESSDAALIPQTTSLTVIGSIETPQVIELRGDVLNPIVQVTVPEYDDHPQSTSVARFAGTIRDSAPIYVDLSDGSVRDGLGNNRRDLLVAGSRFEMLRPGVNQVSIQATNWGNYTAHAITSWRDALR